MSKGTVVFGRGKGEFDVIVSTLDQRAFIPDEAWDEARRKGGVVKVEVDGVKYTRFGRHYECGHVRLCR